MEIRPWDAFKINSKPVIGMLHIPAVPDSPRNTLGFGAIVDWVLNEASALTGGGADVEPKHPDEHGHPPYQPWRPFRHLKWTGRSG